MSAVIIEFAPAKINLTLGVLGRRTDGYHELESLVAFARNVGDVVRLTSADRSSLSVIGPFAAAIDRPNLAERAMRLVAEAAPDYPAGAIELEKNLPVASGVGGGSSDAAAALRALRRLSSSGEERLDWPALARQLGADVPVCLANAPSLMTGVGERLEPVMLPSSLHAVLANPVASPPPDKTARVFAALDAPRLDGAATAAAPPKFNGVEDFFDYAARRANMLEAAAASLMPEIAVALADIQATQGCRLARLSGAGPTCFGLYGSRQEAEAAALRIAGQRPSWWVRAAQLS